MASTVIYQLAQAKKLKRGFSLHDGPHNLRNVLKARKCGGLIPLTPLV